MTKNSHWKEIIFGSHDFTSLFALLLRHKCFVEVSIISDTKRVAGVQMRVSADIRVCVDTREHTRGERNSQAK